MNLENIGRDPRYMRSIILDMIHHKCIIILEYVLLVAATLSEFKSMCGRLDLDDIWAINP